MAIFQHTIYKTVLIVIVLPMYNLQECQAKENQILIQGEPAFNPRTGWSWCEEPWRFIVNAV